MATTHEYMQTWVNLVYASGVLTTELSRRFENELSISLVEQTLLNTVAISPNDVRMVDLAQRVMVSKAAMTKLVDRLEARRLVERAPSPTDRRATVILLTSEGERLVEASRPIMRAFVKERLADSLSDSQLAGLREALQIVLEGTGHWAKLTAILEGARQAKIKHDS